MPAETKRYIAFISYSHKDKAFARRLQRHLEGYKLPSSLRNENPHLPEHLRPIFRDESDLGTGVLDDKLREALDNSRHLIVICSENSVKPNAGGINYVEREIEYFLGEGDAAEERAGRIIPVISRRKGGPATDCMLPILREHGLLGIDVKEKGQKRSYSDIIAGLLGLPPDALWQRERRRQRYTLTMWRTLFWAILGPGGFGCWYYYGPRTEYYLDYVQHNNVPQGLARLNENQLHLHQHHYRFTIRKLRPVEVTCCNDAGQACDPHDEWKERRPVSMELEYNSEGEVIRQIHRDEHGKAIAEWAFTGGRFIDFRRVGNTGPQSLAQLPADGMLQKKQDAANSVTRLEVERDSQGRIIRERFCNVYGVYEQDGNGIWGRRFQRDALGRVTAMCYLNRNGKPMEDRNGVAGYRLTYTAADKPGEVRRIAYVNSRGEPAVNRHWWSSVDVSWDASGYTTTQAYLGTDGQPCLNWLGYAKMTTRYDKQGRFSETRYYGLDGTPCTSVEGIAGVISHRDVLGRGTSHEFLGTDGKPCLHRHGFSRLERRYDTRGLLLQEAWFGLDGKPCLYMDCAAIRYGYDAGGNCVSTAFFGVDGKPCAGRRGYALLTRSYDEKGNCTQQALFGVDGKPCLHEDGYATIRSCYNAMGNRIEEEFFGTDGKPCLHREGYARATYGYDGMGNCTEEAFFGTDGKPCLHRDGYARVVARFDEKGRELEIAFFGTDDRPCLCKEGYARLSRRYDDEGTITEEQRFGLDGHPL